MAPLLNGGREMLEHGAFTWLAGLPSHSEIARLLS
jgi:hypothetical protein